ncbi:sugar phosphate isomerase/epimerase family protein [Runella aurantiaca]|uniref:Sugar phosphate isomerase/epimerase n=1 Tax=Runella aurantiaca TaxID=2282308 RepID=A0A369I8P1_9BACT|nr:TIM barrel protein [Runella aurantiaca]RDB03524.1 sugar phosphate isomerase/epimerase [Runella aurantiaca]
MHYNRRHFIETLAASSAVLLTNSAATFAAKASPISSNQYAWITFYNRDKRDWNADLDASLAEYVKSGLTAYEPSFSNVDEVKRLAPLLKKHNLTMPSAYVGSVLHDPTEGKRSIETALAIAEAAQPLGLKILVSNPSPLKWGSSDIKNDSQLIEQAKNLEFLGSELRKRGVTLAYHTHDVELRAGAREFHHMLQNTDPKNVGFCLDAHWVYRGAGNSQVALFDVVKMYGKRVVELHIRQSVGNVWGETFGEGDIDYPRLVRELKALKVKPLLVLEQCLESQSPNTVKAVEAHQRDLAYAKQVFADWL